MFAKPIGDGAVPGPGSYSNDDDVAIMNRIYLSAHLSIELWRSFSKLSSMCCVYYITMRTSCRLYTLNGRASSF